MQEHQVIAGSVGYTDDTGLVRTAFAGDTVTLTDDEAKRLGDAGALFDQAKADADAKAEEDRRLEILARDEQARADEAERVEAEQKARAAAERRVSKASPAKE